MMRRFLSLVLVAVAARAAAAQMPPSISKPIEQARKAANATNEQSRAMQQQGPPAAVKPATKPAAKPATAPAAQAPARTVPAPVRPAPPQDSGKVTFDREVFTYVVDGRRDPFASPIETGEIRPLIADLKVTGIIFDPRGRNSVAVMRDVSTQEQYRVKTGNILGRAKVAQIKPTEVVMTIDEYGFSRQEILKLAVQKSQQTKRTP
ncbi:MAG: hypothetical protein ACYC3L_12200 [Gemmatimonadaceae bacterium]